MNDATTQNTTPVFVKKRAFAKLAGGVSARSVDNWLAEGLPHLKYGPRSVRIEPESGLAWLREKFGQRRRGAITKPQDASPRVAVMPAPQGD